MGVMIQIRNVPEELHRKLKARAALLGLSLSDYLLGEIASNADKPTIAEWLARLQRQAPTQFKVFPADDIRAERESR